jgi:O-antigen/teichoic acid export membrane protein
LSRDRQQWKTLAGASGWVYLLSIGATIYFTTDRLVIGKVLGTGVIPTYLANSKVCELAVTLIITAAFVSLPKITQWISSPDKADQERLLVELHRLSIFEVILCCGAVLGYLAFNNLFVSVWLDKAHQAPLALQIAFACNLAVTVGGNAGINVSIRAGEKGLKTAGMVIAWTSLLNLVLSVLSVKYGYLFDDRFSSLNGVTAGVIGVSVATVIAQSISSLCLGAVTCRYLKLSIWQWGARCWALPLGFTLAAAALKKLFSDDSILHLSVLSACYGVLFLIVCWLAGMKLDLLRAEIKQVQAMFRNR